MSKSSRTYIKNSRSTFSSCKGRWTQKENADYLKFLLQNSSVFEESAQRKQKHIFLTMAAFLGTRTPDQCRSHHQKVELYSKTKHISGIADYLLKEKLTHSNPELEQIRLKYTNLLETGHEDQNLLLKE